MQNELNNEAEADIQAILESLDAVDEKDEMNTSNSSFRQHTFLQQERRLSCNSLEEAETVAPIPERKNLSNRRLQRFSRLAKSSTRILPRRSRSTLGSLRSIASFSATTSSSFGDLSTVSDPENSYIWHDLQPMHAEPMMFPYDISAGIGFMGWESQSGSIVEVTTKSMVNLRGRSCDHIVWGRNN